jgi:hypothetical protein
VEANVAVLSLFFQHEIIYPYNQLFGIISLIAVSFYLFEGLRTLQCERVQGKNLLAGISRKQGQ